MLELFTFRISHFSEKARWMLDACGARYTETFWTPFFHVVPALRRGRLGTTVPILRHDGGHVQDSTRILHWLDENVPGCALLPADAAQRREVLDIEARFDRVGAHVIRYAYADTLDDRDAVLQLWTFDASPLQARMMRAAYPLMRAAFRRMLGIDAARVQRSQAVIEEALAFIEARLAQGGEYLVGDRLSAADITACALLAPLIGPDEHEVYSRADFRAGLGPRVSAWLDRPAAHWLRRRYREDRRESGAQEALRDRR